jgi:transposase-like protein
MERGIEVSYEMIAGRKYWLWRAVDQHGFVLQEILRSKRDTVAAKRLLVRLMKRHEMMPKRTITDKLRSYGAAKRDIARCMAFDQIAVCCGSSRSTWQSEISFRPLPHDAPPR